jgi:hypothetical protein
LNEAQLRQFRSGLPIRPSRLLMLVWIFSSLALRCQSHNSGSVGMQGRGMPSLTASRTRLDGLFYVQDGTVTPRRQFAILVRRSHLGTPRGVARVFIRWVGLFVALRQSHHKHHSGIGRFHYILHSRRSEYPRSTFCRCRDKQGRKYSFARDI